jgi:hypothetical protein
LNSFDQQFLTLPVANKPELKAYDYRAGLYERASALSDSSTDSNGSTEQLLSRLNQNTVERNDLDKEFKAYAGYATNNVAAVAQFFLGGEFAQAYMKQTAKIMEPVLGFPFLRNATKVVPAKNLDTSIKTFESIAANLKSMGDDLKDPAWKAFSVKMTDLGTVASFLKGKDGKGTLCSVSLKKAEEPASPTEKWRGRYREMRMNAGSDFPRVRTGEEDQDLGKISAASPSYFQLFQLDNETNAALTIGDKNDWGPLALLLKPQAKPEKEGDSRVWIVQRPIDSADHGIVTFKLTFDDPVPDLAHWPKE